MRVARQLATQFSINQFAPEGRARRLAWGAWFQTAPAFTVAYGHNCRLREALASQLRDDLGFERMPWG